MSAIEHVLDLVDLVLVMTVNPGFGGQAYIPTMEPKIAQVRAMIEAAGLADRIDIEVDGGISPATSPGRPAQARTCSSPAAPCSGTPTASNAVTELRTLAEAAPA